MKEKLINHLVNATTKHRKMVIIITILMCFLSILSIMFLLKTDTSYKGLVGSKIKEVDDFDKVIGSFGVSGSITIVTEPVKINKEKVKKYQKDINNAVFNNLGVEGKDKVISIFKEYLDIDGFNVLSDKQVLLIVKEILKLIGNDRRNNLLNSFESLNQFDIDTIETNLLNEKSDPQRVVYRKLQKLKKEDIGKLVLLIDELENDKRDIIVKTTLSFLSVYDKKNIFDTLNIIIEDKEKLFNEIDKIDNEIGLLLKQFKSDSEIFALDLKNVLLSEKLAEASGNNEKIKDIVKGVIYSDEISLSQDGLMYMIMVAPAKNIDERSNMRAFAIAVENELTALKEKHTNINIYRTGFPVLESDEEKAVMQNLLIIGIITVIGILLIFLVGVKRIVFPILAMIPLMIGVLIMFGIFTLIFRTINMFGIMTPIILFGMGIDYAIYLGTRYGEVRKELGEDASQEDILRETFRTLGSGFVVAVLSTIFAFLSLLISTLSGFLQVGLLAASGVLTSFLTMVYILPILITWRERKYKKSRVGFISYTQFKGIGNFSNRFGWIISIIMFGFAVVGLCFLLIFKNMEFEQDFLELEPKGLESVEILKELDDKFDSSDQQTFYIIKGYENLIKFKKELSSEENGVKKYPTINAGLTLDARRAISTFEKLGWDRKLETLNEYKDKYAKKVGIMGNTNQNIAELYEFMILNYVNWEKDEYLVMVFPSEYIWNTEFIDKHISDLKKLDKNTGAEGAGMIEIWDYMMDHMVNDLLIASLMSFIVIVIVLAITTRSLRGTIICSLSILIALIGTLTVLKIINLKLNFFNIVGFPLIIGMGIGYSVYVYYRFMYIKKVDVVAVVSSTGKAVLLSTLTTLMSFGSLATSNHPGLAGFGLLICVGLILSFLSSIFIIPTLVRVFYRKGIK